MDEPRPQWDDELQLVRQGDQGAARRLVDALFPKVIRIIRNHLPVTEDEQDIAQDVFMKVFTKLDQFRAAQPFDHWVARIALNTCYDRLRRQKSRKVMSFGDFHPKKRNIFRTPSPPVNTSPSRKTRAAIPSKSWKSSSPPSSPPSR